MSRELFAVTTNFSVQANFSAWAGGLHAAILNRGWLQSTETGECVPSTVTIPSASAYAGFVVYKTNDGIGDQFFMRLDYGRSSSDRSPRLKIALGTGTNGSGTLTGNLSQVYQLNNNQADQGVVIWRDVLGGDAGRLTYYRSIDTTNPSAFSWGFVVARTVDATGAPNGNGMEMFLHGSDIVNVTTQEFIPGPSYSSVCYGNSFPRGASPLRTNAGTGIHDNWSYGIASYFSHPVNAHSVDSQYPNPNVVIWDGGQPIPSFIPNGIYRLTSYGSAREFIMSNISLDPSVGGACWGFCIS